MAWTGFLTVLVFGFACQGTGAGSDGRSKLSSTGVPPGISPNISPGASRLELPGRGVYVGPQPAPAPIDGGPLLVVLAASWLEKDLPAGLGPTVCVDLPGRGQATSIEPALIGAARMEEDLRDLEGLRQRLGLERMVLLGWSYYGGLAVRYALDYPEHVAGLVLVAPLPPRRAPHWDRFVDRMRLRTDPSALKHLETLRLGGGKRRQPYEFCREFTRLFVESRTVNPVEVMARMQSDPCVRPNLDPEMGSALGQAIITGLGDWDWRAELAELRVPVLLIHGEEDAYPVAGSEEYAQAIEGAQLLVLPETGHLPWLEQPAEFASAIATFLKGVR